MGEKYFILGAGLQGVAAAYDVFLFAHPAQVTLGDSNPALLNQSIYKLKKLLKKDQTSCLRSKVVHAESRTELIRAFKEHHAVLSAVPYFLNPAAARAAIDAKVHYCDLGGYWDSTQKILKLNAQAKKAGVTLIPDCGVSPGLCNSLSVCAMQGLTKPRDITIYCGGLPQTPRPPLGYRVVFSLEGVIGNYVGKSYVLRNGRVTLVPALSEREEINFGPPLGKLEAAITGGATSTCPWTFKNTLRSYVYKTLRYPGHYDRIETLKELGFFDSTPVNVNGYKIIPKNFFIALAKHRLAFPKDRDLLVMRIIASGEKNGKPAQVIYEILEYDHPETGFSAMQRMTGFSAAIVLELLAQNKIAQKGVVPLEKAVPCHLFLQEIRKRGIKVRSSVTSGDR